MEKKNISDICFCLGLIEESVQQRRFEAFLVHTGRTELEKARQEIGFIFLGREILILRMPRPQGKHVTLKRTV